MHQLRTALYEQKLYEMMRLGEILTLHGWVCQQTADFFGDQWPYFEKQFASHPIGSYFRNAGLMNLDMIDTILKSQKKTGLRFGALAVLSGYIQQSTLNFFVEQFFPDHIGESPYMVVDPDNVNYTSQDQFIVFDRSDQEPHPHPAADDENSAPTSAPTIHWLN